jgi:hypothetical protein
MGHGAQPYISQVQVFGMVGARFRCRLGRHAATLALQGALCIVMMIIIALLVFAVKDGQSASNKEHAGEHASMGDF